MSAKAKKAQHHDPGDDDLDPPMWGGSTEGGVLCDQCGQSVSARGLYRHCFCGSIAYIGATDSFYRKIER